MFKIRYLMVVKKNLNGLPNMKIRRYLSSPYFNEYEVYENV